MADALGHLSKMSIYDVGTWETAHPGGQGDTVHFVSEGLTEEYERLERLGLVGSGGAEPSDQGNVEVTGTTLHELDYVNFLIFFKYWFADTSSPYDVSDDTVPYYYWIELEKQVERWRFGPCKLNKITLRGPQDGKVMMELEHTCRQCIRTGTAFNGDTMGSMARVLFKQLEFRIADQVDAIGSGDVVKIESFELVMPRNMKTDDYGSKDSSGDAIYKIEPVPADFREITQSLVVPRYAANTFQGWKQNDTPLMGDLSFVNGANMLLFQLPELRITEGFNANVEGPAPLRQEGALRAYKSSNANMYVGNEVRVTAA
jgi:hypothetical protein